MEGEKPRVVSRVGNQRACNQRTPNGMLCVGRLRRWREFTPDLGIQSGDNVEAYRCEFCHTVYVSKATGEDKNFRN